MNNKALPAAFDAEFLKREVSEERDTVIRLLFEGVLNSRPSTRTTAAEMAQVFQDRYNDACAAGLEDQSVVALFEKCRAMIEACRRYSTSPDMLSESETATLLQYEDSWDDPGSNLRLAPQALFLIGAGIMWGLINIDHIHLPSSIVSRGTSYPKGILSYYDKI